MGTPVKSSFLTINSHIGPTHLQRVSASLLGRLNDPIYPSLSIRGTLWCQDTPPFVQCGPDYAIRQSEGLGS